MRIVALSDQHGHLPEIPECDLLIVAGDICPDRFGPFLAIHHPPAQQAWFDGTARPWLANAPAGHTILTWGNHDWCGQACSFPNDSPHETSSRRIQILVDEAVDVQTPDGGSVSVWASPWSNKFMNWAFMKPPTELELMYAAIPEGIDILVSHQPPYGYGDGSWDGYSGTARRLGSRELLAAIRRVKPKLVICGHIHEGYGRFDCEGTAVYNVSVVDERYRLVREPTVIDVHR